MSTAATMGLMCRAIIRGRCLPANRLGHAPLMPWGCCCCCMVVPTAAWLCMPRSHDGAFILNANGWFIFRCYVGNLPLALNGACSTLLDVFSCWFAFTSFSSWATWGGVVAQWTPCVWVVFGLRGLVLSLLEQRIPLMQSSSVEIQGPFMPLEHWTGPCAAYLMKGIGLESDNFLLVPRTGTRWTSMCLSRFKNAFN